MIYYRHSPLKEGLVLLVVDVISLLVSFNTALIVRANTLLDVTSFSFAWISGVMLLTFYIFDIYHGEVRSKQLQLLSRTAIAVVVGGALIAAIVYLVKPWEEEVLFWRGVLPVSLFLLMVMALSSRYIACTIVEKKVGNLRWLVVGSENYAYYLWKELGKGNIGGKYQYLVDEISVEDIESEFREHIVGKTDDLEEVLERGWTGILLASEATLDNTVIAKLMYERLKGVRIYDITDFYEQFLHKVPILNLKDGWFALSHGFNLLHHSIALRIKRIIDVFLAIIILILAFPLMIIIPILIKLDSKGDIIYSQKRTGLNGEEFTIRKLRTMVEDAEKDEVEWAQENDPRVTRIGKILRALRMDELPQLVNVLLGEMSFVGPRPERPDFNKKLEKHIPYYDLRHLIKPGITGWAQVMYPYGASIDDAREKLQYDLYYIKNYSLFLDLVIAMKTIRVVLFGKGR